MDPQLNLKIVMEYHLIVAWRSFHAKDDRKCRLSMTIVKSKLAKRKIASNDWKLSRSGNLNSFGWITAMTPVVDKPDKYLIGNLQKLYLVEVDRHTDILTKFETLEELPDMFGLMYYHNYLIAISNSKGVKVFDGESMIAHCSEEFLVKSFNTGNGSYSRNYKLFKSHLYYVTDKEKSLIRLDIDKAIRERKDKTSESMPLTVEVQIDPNQVRDFVSYFDIDLQRGNVLAMLRYGKVLYCNSIIADLGHPDLDANNDSAPKPHELEPKSQTAYHDCIAIVGRHQFMTTTSITKSKTNTVRLFTIKGRLTDEVVLEQTVPTRNITLFTGTRRLQMAVIACNTENVWIIAMHRGRITKFNDGQPIQYPSEYLFGAVVEAVKGKPDRITVYGQGFVCDLSLDL